MHEDEVGTNVALGTAFSVTSIPSCWAPISRLVGGGTDNTMYRLGPDRLIRLPRTAETAAALRKELRWLPHLSALLDRDIPALLN